MAKAKVTHVAHRIETEGCGTKTACGMMLRDVRGVVRSSWAGVKCKKCLKVKEANARKKAAYLTVGRKKGGKK